MLLRNLIIVFFVILTSSEIAKSQFCVNNDHGCDFNVEIYIASTGAGITCASCSLVTSGTVTPGKNLCYTIPAGYKACKVKVTETVAGWSCTIEDGVICTGAGDCGNDNSCDGDWGLHQGSGWGNGSSCYINYNSAY